ncbi:MAG: SDR family oxidoreductase [Rubrobacteraceae bacterium]|nr:SDR family oxidoreductase [Rubrobacteraceae bacterium]MDQ3436774.1 SDR family oxidoreductase [Actinomycetota bacterium]
MIDTGLEDRVVLITGGNHGIGAATARAFSVQGARVFITYLRLSPQDYGIDPEEARRARSPGLPLYHATQTRSADELVREIRKGGGRVESWETDLTYPAKIPELFDRAEEMLGPVNVLVNNAAYCETPPDTIFSTSGGSIDKHFAVNTRAVVLLMAELARRHEARGGRWGRVINVSTDAAQNFASQISYGASKAAIEAFTRSVATEVGPLGITVNSVAPGPVQTGYITQESEEELLPSIPLRRIGEPQDIADAIVFLASEQACWITGQVIKVSGGHAI